MRTVHFLRLVNALRRLLFGDDVFVSYARADASEYAFALAQRLTQRGISCYLDQWGAPPGKTVSADVMDALRNSTLFVVITTESSAKSENVGEEVVAFVKLKRPIIPVIFGDPSLHAIWADAIHGIALAREPVSALADAEPTDRLVERIRNAEGFTRRNVRLGRIATVTAGIVGALLIASIALVTTLRTSRNDLTQTQARLADAQTRTDDANRSAAAAEIRQREAMQRADTAAAQAELANSAAQKAQAVANQQERLAETRLRQAEELGRISTSAKLAASAHNYMPAQPEVAAVLAMDAYGASPTPQARAALYEILAVFPRLVAIPATTGNSPVGMAFSRSTGGLALVREGYLYLYQAKSYHLDGPLLPLPGSDVSGFAVSPDGREIAAAGAEGQVTLVDIARRSVQLSSVGAWRFSSATYLPDGKRLVLGTDEDKIVVWSTEMRRVLWTFSSGHRYAVRSLTAHPTQPLLASTGWDGVVRLWRLREDGAALEAEYADEARGIIRFSDDGRYLAYTTENGVLVRDSSTNAITRKIAQSDAHPRSLAFAATGARVAAGFNNGRVVVRDLDHSDEAPLVIQAYQDSVDHIAFTLDGSEIVSVGGGDHVRVWSIERENQLATSMRADVRVDALAISPDGQSVLTAETDQDGDGHTVFEVLDFSNREQRSLASLPFPIQPGQLVFDPAHHLAAAANFGSLWLLDLRTSEGKLLPSFFDSNLTALALSADGALLAAGTDDGQLLVYRTRSEDRVDTTTHVLGTKDDHNSKFGLNLREVRSIGFTPDARVVILGSALGAVWAYDRATRQWLGEPIIRGNPRKLLYSMGLSPVYAAALDADRIVAAGGDEVRVLSLDSPQSVSGIVRTRANATCLASAPSAWAFAICVDRAALSLFDVASQDSLEPPLRSTAGVKYAAMSSRGRAVVTSSEDGVVTRWNTDPADWVKMVGEKLRDEYDVCLIRKRFGLGTLAGEGPPVSECSRLRAASQAH